MNQVRKMIIDEHDRKQSISQSFGVSTTSTACKYCMNNECGGDTITRLPCTHKFHHTSTNNRLLLRNKSCSIRTHAVFVKHVRVSNAYYRTPRWLWVYQLMELFEALIFKSE